jgi:hypothetical protein
MKVDKIVFSCSEYYAPFWNIQSQIWKTKFNIDPVCLLFGKQANVPGMTDKYGEIIETSFDPELPDIIQIQFSKFHQPTKEPEKTWMIGDMDQIPLQTAYFLDFLKDVPDDAYAHLNYTLTAQMRPYRRPDGFPGIPADVFLRLGSFVNGGYDLPGHYHAAKGSLYETLFFKGESLKTIIRKVMELKIHGMVQEEARRSLNPAIHGQFWVAEEGYTSEQIWYGLKSKKFNGFYGKEYHIWDQKIDRVGYRGGQWNGTDYVYDAEKLRTGGYVDIHCHRPYSEQEGPLMKVLQTANMI